MPIASYARRSGLAFVVAVFAWANDAQAWTENVLHSFAGGSDGAYPFGGVIADKAGDLFGTTSQGGGGCKRPIGYGMVFKLAPDGTETVLHAFASRKDGNRPVAGLVADNKGNLYGTTTSFYDYSTVFKITPQGVHTILHTFTTASDGYQPMAPLILDSSGNLYGTTAQGGSSSTACDEACGTVFKISTKGAFTVLYDFQAGTDGMSPQTPLIFDAAGDLYGTTVEGGSTGCGGLGCGTVFRLASDGTETVLYAFAGGSDGWAPLSGLSLDSAGNLYGTTFDGGGTGCESVGCGTVFKLAPDGTETILSEFNTSGGPAGPRGAIVRDNKGRIFGTTQFGGASGCGTVFELPPGQMAKAIYSFTCGKDGKWPQAGLLKGASGEFYGTSEEGGDSGDGTVFSVQK